MAANRRRKNTPAKRKRAIFGRRFACPEDQDPSEVYLAGFAGESQRIMGASWAQHWQRFARHSCDRNQTSVVAMAPASMRPTRNTTYEPSPYGIWLRNERQKIQGLSQHKLAQLSGVHRLQIVYIEVGRTRWPQVETQRKLAEALGVVSPPEFEERAHCFGPRARSNTSPQPSPYGIWLRNERQKIQGLSQAKLAQLSGVHRTQIAYVELGYTQWPHLETQRKLAEALGVVPPADFEQPRKYRSQRCSFCGTHERDCRHLMDSQVGVRSRICDACVTKATGAFALKERHRRLRIAP